jgi:hypothetical protein
MSSGQGLPGEPGHPGEQGETGKETGEGGRGGEGGLGGRGGAGAPQGPGGGGGVGGGGGRGARGAQGEPGERGPAGAQPKLRWTPAIGYVLLAAVLVFLIVRVQTTCTDTRAAFALRKQWERVADVIDAQKRGKVTPTIAATVGRGVKAGDRLTPEIARDAFVASYRQAIEEAGPAPTCRALFP